MANKISKRFNLLITISTPNGYYEWIILLFGLKNILQIFQRNMNKIFFNCLYWQYSSTFQNISRTSCTFKDILWICVKIDVILSQKKAEINKNVIGFLKMIISKNIIEL